ncbi:MAG: DUF2325 domain-containing protein [Pseudomonadota bacterium]
MCDKHLGLQFGKTKPALAPAIPSMTLMEASCPRTTSRNGRFHLWTIKESVHCSIIGTCASVNDIKRLAAKVGIELLEDATDYVVHGYLVQKSSVDTPFSRAFQKLMDSRYAGALRKVKRATDASQLDALWDEMRDTGQIASAYWAFMTMAHVPDAVRERIFGEVHMFSHLAGANYARKSVEVVELDHEIATLTDRLEKQQLHREQAIEARDARITHLEAKLDDYMREATGQQHWENSAKTLQADLDKAQQKIAHLEDALSHASERVRCLENNAVTEECLDSGSYGDGHMEGAEASSPVPHERENAGLGPANEPLKVLYLGGRNRQIPHLRSIAEEQTVELLHHDGGKENAVSRIDTVLPSVDCVMCPIDCISHDACLRAKQYCHKRNTPFVPLRTASAAAFKAALKRLRDEAN